MMRNLSISTMSTTKNKKPTTSSFSSVAASDGSTVMISTTKDPHPHPNGVTTESSVSGGRGGRGNNDGGSRNNGNSNGNSQYGLRRPSIKNARRAVSRVIPRTYSAIVRKTRTRGRSLHSVKNTSTAVVNQPTSSSPSPTSAQQQQLSLSSSSNTTKDTSNRTSTSSMAVPAAEQGSSSQQHVHTYRHYYHHSPSPPNCNETIRKNTYHYRKVLDEYLQAIGKDWEMLINDNHTKNGEFYDGSSFSSPPISSLRMDCNDTGICTFAYKQFIIVVEMPKESTCFFVYTCLKHCTNRCTPIMKRALELNYLTQQTNGCTIGIDSTLGVTTSLLSSPKSTTPTTTMAVAMGGPSPYFNDNEKDDDNHEMDDDEKLDVIVDYDDDIIEEFEAGHHFESNHNNYYNDDDPLELTLSYTHPIVGLTQGEFCNILVNFMETAEALYDDLDSVQEKAPTYTNDEMHHGKKEDKEDESHEDCGSSLSSSLGGGGGHRRSRRPPLPSSGNSSTTTNNSSYKSTSSVRSISPPLSYHASFPPSPISLEDKLLGVSNPFHIYTPPARKTHSNFDDDVHPSHHQPRPDTPPPPPLLTLCDTVKVSNKKTGYFSPSPEAKVDESKMAPVAITAMSFEKLSTSKVTKSPHSMRSPLKIPTPKFATKIPTPKFATTLDSTTASSSSSSSASGGLSFSTKNNVFGNRVNGNFHVVQKQKPHEQQQPKRHDGKEEEESSRSCQRPNSPAANRLNIHKNQSM